MPTPTDRVANVAAFLVNNDGTLAGFAEVKIEPNEQQAKVLTDLFPSVTEVDGFLIAVSDNIGVVGFFLTFAPDISQIDGAEASRCCILPRSILFFRAVEREW